MPYYVAIISAIVATIQPPFCDAIISADNNAYMSSHHHQYKIFKSCLQFARSVNGLTVIFSSVDTSVNCNLCWSVVISYHSVAESVCRSVVVTYHSVTESVCRPVAVTYHSVAESVCRPVVISYRSVAESVCWSVVVSYR